MEPMMMGSPNGSPLLVASSASGYLPSYLMGEPPTSGRSNTLSPTKMRSAMSDPNRSTVQQQMMQHELDPSTVHIPHDYLNQTTVNHNTMSGPPTMGLYESYRNEKILQLNTPTPGAVSFDKGAHNDTPLNQSGFNLSRILSPIPVPMAAEVEDVRRAASPSQSMMFNLSTAQHKNGNNYWITVYGFPETACKTILAHFSRCGNIMDTRFAANGNWMHIRYSSRHECDKAINYNGRIVGQNLMIGVKNCTDAEIVGEMAAEVRRPLQMRSLNHVAYQNAQNEISIAPLENNHPKLENGFMQKAMDLFFNW